MHNYAIFSIADYIPEKWSTVPVKRGNSDLEIRIFIKFKLGGQPPEIKKGVLSDVALTKWITRVPCAQVPSDSFETYTPPTDSPKSQYNMNTW